MCISMNFFNFALLSKLSPPPPPPCNDNFFYTSAQRESDLENKGRQVGILLTSPHVWFEQRMRG